MEPRNEPTTTIDLTELERSLLQRACWYEDPAAYREGVRDTVAELRRSLPADQGRADGPIAV